MKLSQAQVSNLNACWNSVYRRIFGFNRWESVRIFINGIGRLDFYHIRELLRLKFFSRGMVSKNVTLARAMKLFFCSDTFKHLSCVIGLHVTHQKHFRSLPFGTLRKAVRLTFEATCMS